MNKEELEDLYLRSLDEKLSSVEEEQLLRALEADPDQAKSLDQYKTTRVLLRASNEATFGPYFAAKLIHKIQNTGIAIDRQLFGVFRKFQLAAIGVIVAFLILNIVFSEQNNVKSVLGFEDDSTVTQEQEQEQTAPFDFSETFKDLYQ